ncbi:HAD family hydrolase [Candidatus Woesearchaeota archaeon]|nr:HAD family hydrolase [Candidatus Woesearchaeota archaeon]
MTSEPLRGIIFDVDGGIIESMPDQLEWLRHCCEDLFGIDFQYDVLDVRFQNDYNDAHRKGMPALYQHFGINYEQNKDLLWEHYIEWKKTHERPVVPEMAKAIKEIYAFSRINGNNVGMMINTTNNISSYESVLNEAGVLDCMGFVIDYEYLKKFNAEDRIKPDTFSIELCLAKMRTNYDNTMHVVDTVDDIEASINKLESKETGLDIVVVSWGYESRVRLEEAKKTYSQLNINIIDKPFELVDIVKARL